MASFRPEAIANKFLELSNGAGLTQMQLQKLVYIAHGWSLAISGKPLTSVEPEAWDRGPVYPTLRNRISHVGAQPVTDKIHENDENPFAVLAEESRGREISANFSDIEKKIISLVWSRYGHLHGVTLSDLTHEPGTPWSAIYDGGKGRNASIPNRLIESHYTEMANQIQNSTGD